MSITETYYCDVCKKERDKHHLVPFLVSRTHGPGLLHVPFEEAGSHVCVSCASSISEMKVCIQGIVGCAGGTKCGSSHK